MSDRYRIQRLDGYTDGKPLWFSVRPRYYFAKDEAEEEVRKMLVDRPDQKFRIRKVPKRR